MTDVLVIGAGPAGLVTASYLAQAGARVVVVEKAHHPRPHVGESLMPAVIPVFQEIGFLPVMEAAGFPRSHGVVYHAEDGRTTAIEYKEYPQEDVAQDYTYHVDRSKMDLLLLKHAEGLGCRIVQGVSVAEVLFDEHAVATGALATVGDEEVELAARVVVDAAGRVTKLGRQLDLRQSHPVLDQFALHAWFEGVERGTRKRASFTHVFLIPEVRGWVWQAPIDDTITSIGLVADRRIYQESGSDVREFFASCMNANPALSKALRVVDQINELKGEVNYSYQLERICGDGWLAVGDAARFVDPIFSSGVSVAVHSARFAAERILTALDADDVSRATFLPYEESVFEGAEIWDDFVRLFYEMPSAFFHFVESTDHRLPILRLLQGEVHHRHEAAVLDDLRSLIVRARGQV